MEPSGAAGSEASRGVFSRAAEADVGNPHVRRIRGLDASVELLAHERVIIVCEGATNGVMSRHARLNEDLSPFRTATGPSGDLAQQLETPLRCPEIWKIDPDVGVDDRNECHVRKVEPLRDHLRAEQNVDLPVPDAVENHGMRPLVTRSVDIHARDPRAGEPLAEEALDLPRTETTLT